MRILRVLCLLTVLSSSVRAEELPALRWSRGVVATVKTPDELVSVTLDRDVFAGSRDGFPDLRIISAEQQGVPYLIRKATKSEFRTVRKTWRAGDLSGQPRAGQGLEIRVTLDKDDPQPDGLSVMTPLKNFEQRVQVFGTVPGAEEIGLVSESLIFDYSQYMDLRRLDVPLPKNTCRRFRILIDALTVNQESQLLDLTRRLRGTEEADRQERTTIERRPFRIERIEFWGESKLLEHKSEIEAPVPAVMGEVRQDSEQRQTVIEVRSQREPLTGLKLECASRNFSRRASVQISTSRGVQSSWREIGQATVSRFEIADLKEEQLTIRFPEQRHATYRLVIDNRDSPPLEVTQVAGIGPVYEALFLAQPQDAFELRYGSETAQVPQYDTAALQLAVNRGVAPVKATLADQKTAAPGGAAPFNFKAIINNPIVLGVVICTLMGLFGVGLFRASKRISELPKEE